MNKKNILLVSLALLIPSLPTLVKGSCIVLMVFDSLKIKFYSDFKNNSYMMYNTFPVKRNYFILEAYIFMTLLIIWGALLFCISEAIYSKINIFYVISVIVFSYFIGCFYSFLSFILDPIKAIHFLWITVLIFMGIISKTIISLGSKNLTSLLHLNNTQITMSILTIFAIILCFYYVTSYFYNKKDL